MVEKKTDRRIFLKTKRVLRESLLLFIKRAANTENIRFPSV